MENTESIEKVQHATKWSFITNIMRKMISPITNMALARILAPEIFGLVATINIVVSFADLFTDAGFQKYLVQHEFSNEEKLKESANVAFWSNFVFSIVIWIIILLFRKGICNLVGNPGYELELVIAALSIPLLSFSSIQQAMFVRKFDFKGMFVPRLINTLIPVFITIPLALLLKNCWAIIIGTLLSNFSDALILTIKSDWKPKLFYNIRIFVEMMSFSIWTMLEQLSIWLSLNIDVFILGNIISQHNLGLYKVSYTTVSQIVNLISVTFIPVLFAALSRCQKNDKRFKQTFLEMQRKCAILLVPIGIGIFLYRDTITTILLGEKWVEASYAIGVYGIGQSINVLTSSFSGELYRAKGNPKISAIVQVFFVVTLIPLVLYGSTKSFNFLCTMKTISYILFSIVHFIILTIKYKFNFIQLLFNLKNLILPSLIMILSSIVLNKLFNGVIWEVISIIICAIVYLLVCISIKNIRKDMDFFMKKILYNKT